MKIPRLILFIFMLTFTSATFAEDDSFLEVGNKNYEIGKSSWIFSLELGGTGIHGDDSKGVNFGVPDYDGLYADFSSNPEENNYKLFGGSLVLGRDFYMGNMVFGVSVSGFHYKETEDVTGKVSENVDYDLTEEDNYIEMNGVEGLFSIGYLTRKWQMGLIYFAEFGIGSGVINTRYFYEYIDINDLETDLYDLNRHQNFNHSKVTLGIKSISSKGMMSWLKISQKNMVLDEARGKHRSRVGAGAITIGDVGEGTKEGSKLSLLDISIGLGLAFQ